MRFLCLILLGSGCAYISDKHEAWRLDPDDDGVQIGEDCDNDDSQVGKRTWYIDQDEDGFGAEDDVPTYGCEQPDGYVEQKGDCDDFDRTVFPGAVEQCDGVDNNCNAEVDEGLERLLVYADDDGDGFGDPDTSQEACVVQPGFVDNGDDCDDDNPFFRQKGDAEIPYNGVDDNCDSADGDGDGDGDTYWATDYVDKVDGDPMPIPEGKGGDCDDSRDDVHPGAVDEWYDGIDSNCGGENDCDIDGDGFMLFVEGVCELSTDGGAYDCDDHDPDINPGAEEVCDADGRDENCNGDADEEGVSGCKMYYFDADEDGYGDSATAVCRCEADFLEVEQDGDCIPDNENAHPGVELDPPYDGQDWDCLGDDDYDYDRDGYVATEHVGFVTEGAEGSGALPGGDCNDDDSSINPEGIELVADGLDSNCDGLELCYVDHDGDGHAEPSGMTMLSAEPDCSADHAAALGAPADDCVDTDPEYHPGAVDEWYDAEDKDCAGNDDFDQDGDGHSNQDWDPSETYWLAAGEWIPVAGATIDRVSAMDCDDMNPATHPGADEYCDGVDSNCNVEPDDGALDAVTLYVDTDGDGFGDPEPSLSLVACAMEGYVELNTDCNDSDGAVYPEAGESCDATDSDCDGDLVDEFIDLDSDATPDCLESPLVSDLAEGVLFGIAGGQTGRSMLIGDTGTLYIGAPTAVDTLARVYVLEELIEPSIDMESTAHRLTRNVQDFGLSLAELPGELGPKLVVGSPDENAIVRVDDPLVGHEIGFSLSDESGIDRFASLAAVPVAGSTQQCGYSVAVTDVDYSLTGVVVGCPLNVGGGYILREDAWVDHVRFDDLESNKVSLGTGVAFNEEFGYSISVGDINGDGFDDTLVGSRHDDYLCSGSNCGAAYLYVGGFLEEDDPTDISYLDFDAVFRGDQEADSLGANVEVVGDLDGDGLPDFMISTDHGWNETAPSAGSGAVLVYTASMWSGEYEETDADFGFVGTEVGSQFGYDSAIVPDVDGDGQAELIVSAYSSDLVDEDAGAVFGFYGAWTDASGTTRSADDLDVTRMSGAASGHFGRSVVVGDVGADGEVEVLIAEPGGDQVWLLSPLAMFPE